MNSLTSHLTNYLPILTSYTLASNTPIGQRWIIHTLNMTKLSHFCFINRTHFQIHMFPIYFNWHRRVYLLILTQGVFTQVRQRDCNISHILAPFVIYQWCFQNGRWSNNSSRPRCTPKSGIMGKYLLLGKYLFIF